MKRSLFLYILLALFTSSCAYQFQVFDTTSTEVIGYKDDVYLYESENVNIYYDFWAEGGLMIFKIYNNTDQPIFISLDNSGFIFNDVTIEYGTQNISDLVQYAILYDWDSEEDLKIPPKEGIQMEGYPINFSWYHFGKKTKYKDFDKDNSPFQFTNKIAYFFESDPEEILYVNNEFWVSEVTGLKFKEFQDLEMDMENNKSDKFFVPKQSATYDGDVWVELALSFLDMLVFFL